MLPLMLQLDGAAGAAVVGGAMVRGALVGGDAAATTTDEVARIEVRPAVPEDA